MIECWNDQGIGDFALFFVRTKDGKESNFLIVKNDIPWCLFEVKIKDAAIAKHHLKHAELLSNIHLRVSASRFFSN